jgi:PIN domain nuclease of toxin-antitoxin system
VKLFLDAQVLIWTVYAPDLLAARARQLVEDDTNELLVSHASLWEILAKIGRGKLLMAGESVEDALDDLLAVGFVLRPITSELIVAASTLPHHHSDPFDRMLVAQAIAEDAAILSTDHVLPNYGVRVLWK